MRRIACYLCVILATFFWGSSFHASKVTVNAMPPFTAAALRFGGAAAVLLVLCGLLERNAWAQARRNLFMLLLLGIIGITGFSGFLFWGLAHTSAINGSMIMGTNPLMVLVFARLLDGDAISRGQKIGGLLGVLGVIAVVAGGSWDKLVHLQVSKGDGLVLLANVCWALYTVLLRRVHGVQPLVITTVTTVAGALGLAAIAQAEQGGAAVQAAAPGVWYALGYLAIFGSVLAFLFWNWGVALLGAHRTSIFFNLVPLFAVVVSLGLGGSVAMGQLLGGGLIVAGVLSATGVLRLSLPAPPAG